LFFVLSGYLISGLLFREYLETGRIRIGRFILRRGLKIWPALYVYLAVMVIPLAYYPGGAAWSSLAASGLYYANYHFPVLIVAHTWSLAVEEQFYILLPLLFVLLIRRNWLRWIPVLWSVLSIMSIALCFGGPGSGIEYCASSLFTGVLLRYWREFSPELFRQLQSAYLLPVAAICLILSFSKHFRPEQFVLLEIAFGLILCCTIDRNLRLPWIAFIGVYSYSIYLWQQPFTGIFGRFRSANWFAASVIAAILTGIFMSKLVEWPVVKWRDRILPSRCWR